MAFVILRCVGSIHDMAMVNTITRNPLSLIIEIPVSALFAFWAYRVIWQRIPRRSRPFVRYMKQIPNELADRVTKAIDYAVKAIRDGSQDGYDAVSKELSEIQQQANSEMMDVMYYEFRDTVMRYYRSLGMSAKEAEKTAESKVKEIVDRIEKVHGFSPIAVTNVATKTAKWRWLKISLAAGSAIVLISFAISSGSQRANELMRGVRDINQQTEVAQINRKWQERDADSAADKRAIAAEGGLQGMNNALPDYVVGYKIGTAIFDSLFLTIFLSIITIIRFFVARKKQKLASA
jgi:hypothetical protein